LQVGLRAILSNELQRVQFTVDVAHRNCQGTFVEAEPNGWNSFTNQVWMIRRRRFAVIPDPVCAPFRLGLILSSFLGAALLLFRDLGCKTRFLLRCTCVLHVRSPVFPALPIVPVVETTRGDPLHV